MRQLKILLDVDGPIADFVSAAVRVVNDLGGLSITPDDVTDWEVADFLPEGLRQDFWDRVTAEGFCSDLEPVPGAVEAIGHLMANHDVYFVTSDMATSKTWAWERREWLKNYLGVSSKRVVHAHAKYLVAGDVFVDDKPDHVESWRAQHLGGRALLWSMPHNVKAQNRRIETVTSWPDVLREVDRYKVWLAGGDTL